MADSKTRVREFLNKLPVGFELRDFEQSTKNSALAAQSLGCTVAEIAKSIVFLDKVATVVVISGDRRVSIDKLSKATGSRARIATADEVRENTGYPIGGVPPFPHEKGVRVLLDTSLLRFESVWAAAGTPSSVFRMKTADILSVAGTTPTDLST